MGEVADSAERDFWRPPITGSSSETLTKPGMVEACDRCETEFMAGARFCHVCGASRPATSSATSPRNWARYLDFQSIKQRLNLSTAALIAFVIGVGCCLAAVAVGLIFSAQTLLDWQAVQAWRMQWLLASAVAFLAGILLNKRT